ncbi:PDZ domain-containing protein [Streptomyces sp. J2-1]|uniref:PDZ domain-containing protein n=1 Tax=Streptomyces corallincola TaxID=2851888 RepID=UPI001C38AC5E|nr:PDZ domain-containing protein [Streptomyces corallincola]MBV2354254.1 PDZ domain-containing protein [Streptomyces corallincola]
MDDTALRPRPMPGRDRRTPDPTTSTGPTTGTDTGTSTGPTTRTPPRHPRRRARPVRSPLPGLLVGLVLVLSGIGLGTVGAAVTGLGGRAAGRENPARPAAPAAPTAPLAAAAPEAPAAPAVPATLGLEAVDDERPGALVIAVHVPGPGYTAGLVRGDVLLQFGGARVDTAADLARAVARVGPGTRVTLTVRHAGGGFQQLTAVPGVVV